MPLVPAVPLPPPALIGAASVLSYGESLAKTLDLMERERHKDALKPLRAALTQDRNESLGAITLGTLYLHCDSPERAAREFARARRLAPGEPLAIWGAALAELSAGRTANVAPLLAGLSDSDGLPVALLRDYLRFLGSDGALTARYAEVTPEETDPLRLELAAFVAARAKQGARAETLFTALTARPGMMRLQEETALVLPFDPQLPAQGCAGTLPTALGFPEPTRGERALSGRITLTPPDDVARGRVGYVSYSVDGGYLSASTNSPPFTCDWNTLRVPNGEYTLRTQVFDGAQRLIKEVARTVTVSNAGSTAESTRLTETERGDLRRRLKALLVPRVCKKAAYFALAERAVERADSAAALTHIESVVSIDPNFHGARQSLRQFNRQIIGPCEGIWKGQTDEKLVALTFDDGPNPLPTRTPALLDALKAANATGTFFVVGKMVEQSPELARRMIADGHEIGNHSFSHPNLTYLSASAVEKELCRTSCIVRDITGIRPRFYRPPGGNFNTATVDAARDLGMAGAYWTVDGIRLETAPLPPSDLTKFVLQNVRPGSIVLLHNAPDNTIRALPDIVRGLRERGYSLVSMSELVRRSRPVLKTAATPKAAKMFDGGK